MRQLFSFLIVIIILSSAVSSFAVLPDSSVYIPFNADWNAITSGGSDTANWSVAENRAPYSVEGVYGNALELNPVAAHDSCGAVYFSDGGSVDAVLDSGLTQFTICGWFKTNGITANGDSLIVRGGNGGGAVSGYLRLTWDQWGRLQLRLDEDLNEGQWHYFPADMWTFFAVTYDGTLSVDNVTWYRGGINSAAFVQPGHSATKGSIDAGSVGTSDQPLFIGNNSETGDDSFKGDIDELRIYNQILTPEQIEEVRQLINTTPPVDDFYAPIPEPLFYLPFDGSWENEGLAGQDTVSVIGDYSEVDNDVNMPTFSVGIRGECLDLSARESTTTTETNGALRYGDNADPNSPMKVAINGLRSFTVCGWMKIDGPTGTTMGDGSTPFFFQARTGQMYEYKMRFITDLYGRPRTVLNHNWGPWTPHAYWNIKPEDGWQFRAVTYNADDFTQEEKYYYAQPGATAQIRATRSHSAGVLEDSIEPIKVFPTYDGWADELYLFGSKTNGSGALSLEQIRYVAAMVNAGFVCGTDGYAIPLGDANRDCVVDVFDFAVLAESWLNSSN